MKNNFKIYCLYNIALLLSIAQLDHWTVYRATPVRVLGCAGHFRYEIDHNILSTTIRKVPLARHVQKLLEVLFESEDLVLVY